MRKESIKLSVIIPVYNMEKYLRYSLDSVLNQDLADMEIICINDGSTDSSLTILRQYQRQNDRLVVFDQENRGVANSRNLGICKAAGKYVAFLDPDDILPGNDILSVLYQAAEKNDVLIAGGEFSDMDRSGRINDHYEGTLAGYAFQDEGIVYYTDYQFDYGYHRFIYNREFLLRHHLAFPELVRFQDPPFMVQAFTLAERFYAVKKVTYCYRINYHLIDWNKKKVGDLLTGLHMNIRWAAQHQLIDLMDLTIERMADEYGEVIMSHFVKEAEIRDKMYGIIKDELVRDNRRMREFTDALPGYLIDQYDHLLESKTYKLGSMILYLPKKLKKIFCGKF